MTQNYKSTGRLGRAIGRRTVLGGIGGAGVVLSMPHLGATPAVAEEPRYGGTLRVSTNTGFSNLNPISVRSIPEFAATKWLYSNLTRVDHAGAVHPDLAESWEAADDNAQSWIFKLRQGAMFHIGREVTAEDVVATFTKVMDPETIAPYRSELGPIDTVEALDTYTVKFNLTSPFADFPVTVSTPAGRIIAREGLEDTEVLATEGYGSGPFKLVGFSPDNHVTLERFDDYFKPGLPYLDGVKLLRYPEAAIEMNAILRQETDLLIDVAPEFFGSLSTSEGIDALRVKGGSFVAVVVPCDKPPFDDNRVREALKLTVDRNLVLAGVFNMYGEVAHDHPVSNAYPYYTPMDTRERDIEKAKALLKEAGYENGLKFTLYASVIPPAREKLAVILKEMAWPAGFDIDVEIVSYDRYLAQIWNKAVPYVVHYTTRATTDGILMKLFHPTEGLDEGRWASSYPDAVKILEQARETVDVDERQGLYDEFCQIARDTGPFVLPAFNDELGAKGSYVMGYNRDPVTREVDIENVWLTAEAPAE